ncbi:DUF1120 domain-containing protein [Candidatus Pantoea deserta]|uniref:DUF1120 domain-containing protein n=1 Tax=Candidatus Pantoea deserta TaxID=1869313 RepID=A0A3N4PBY3_9GAMM|nr:DUF1120 domain-containing protein [Pantoea deserta]RPE01230.1 DUF1120 domain-containing protein [Pantoea deserta]
MSKILLSSVIAMTMGSVSAAVYAADSATLSLTGSISPSSCDVSLSAESIDFGRIPASSLDEEFNEMMSAPFNVSVTCDAATAVAVQAVDNRLSSAMSPAELESSMGVTFPALTEKHIFGLGNDSANEKVGAMVMTITEATLGGVANNNVLSSSDKSAWTMHRVSSTSSFPLAKDSYFALGKTVESISPAPVTNSNYTLKSGVFLKRAGKYPSGEEVNVDGNVTFSIVYL